MMGIRLVQEVARATPAHGGDGTTTATLLAAHSGVEGLSLLDSGLNPSKYHTALEVILETCEVWIEDFVIDPDDEEEKQQQIFEVATVAANNDPALGGLIVDALRQTNYEGIITVEESHTTKHSFDIVEGMEIDAGLLVHTSSASKVSLSRY